MSFMFSSYSSPAALDLSHFDTSSVTDMSSMFCDYNGPDVLSLPSFTISQNTDLMNMFNTNKISGITPIAELDISGMDLTLIDDPIYIFKYLPSSCRILVKDQASRDYLQENLGTDYTSIIIKS